jgi:subfamily B ATP-binding cassette protein MsbA
MLYDPVKKMSKLNNALQEGLAAVDRIFEILDEKSEIREKDQPLHLTKAPLDVRFEGVGFAYADGGKKVLEGIDLEVRPGEVLALVGMSGGGKTSLVNLIPRFYDVSEGSIRIGGVDIRDFSLASLRAQIAVVTQEPILFNDTIRANIAYGRAFATEEEIVSAAQAAYAHDFIMKMPRGYDTGIGELGGRLSGGERQRLCIARALIKDAPILILDEATSALDTEAEQVVQKALDNLMAGRTTFVIAHRLSTITRADAIAVLVDGRIVEIGRHEALLAKNAAYAKLYRMQFARERQDD